MRHFPQNRLYRFLIHPLTFSAGLLLLGLSLVSPHHFFFCCAPGFVLCFSRLLLALHRQPDCTWRPGAITLRALSDNRIVRISRDLIFTGHMHIACVSSPIALSKTLSIRAQSSTFLLATGAALTCPFIADENARTAVHHGLAALGVDLQRMQQQWRLLSCDSSGAVTSVTVQDGKGSRCFCCGDPMLLILSCGQLMTGAARPMETEDRTRLLHTLDDMQSRGGRVFVYAMLDDASQPLEHAAFLGMLSMEPEMHASAPQELSVLAAEADVFADFPDGTIPEALRGMVHSSERCPDVPLRFTPLPRHENSMSPVSDRLDGWADSFVQWRRWSRELLLRSRHAMMSLLPTVLWLLLAIISPGEIPLLLCLLPLPAMVFLWLQQALPTPRPSQRWMVLWPLVTLLFAFLIRLFFPDSADASVFLPGMYVASLSSLVMLCLPLYSFLQSRHRRTFMLVLLGVCLAAAAVQSLIAPGAVAATVAILSGGVWGGASMHFLCRRIEDRL